MSENQTGGQTIANEIPQDARQIHQTIIVQNKPAKSNGIGVAGFVLALLGLFLSWVPILGWIIWFLGFLFSLIGLFKSPRGLAIAGFVISIIGFIFLIAVVGLIVTALALA